MPKIHSRITPPRSRPLFGTAHWGRCFLRALRCCENFIGMRAFPRAELPLHFVSRSLRPARSLMFAPTAVGCSRRARYASRVLPSPPCARRSRLARAPSLGKGALHKRLTPPLPVAPRSAPSLLRCLGARVLAFCAARSRFSARPRAYTARLSTPGVPPAANPSAAPLRAGGTTPPRGGGFFPPLVPPALKTGVCCSCFFLLLLFLQIVRLFANPPPPLCKRGARLKNQAREKSITTIVSPVFFLILSAYSSAS